MSISNKLAVLALLAISTPALANEFTCVSGGETLTVTVTEKKISLDPGYDDLFRETQDPDCVYRENKFACYEDGQMMVNFPLALASGRATKGTMYMQSDTGDNADEHNHALLGEPYKCVAK